MRDLRLLAMALVLFAAVGCERRARAARAARADAAVFAWAQCTDCMHRQLETVVALGDTAVPRLERLVIEGAPPKHDSAYLVTLQRVLGAPGTTQPGGIAAHRQAFSNTYRRRAMFALTAIGTERAGTALCLALASGPSASDALAIDSSLARIGRTCP